MDRTKGRVKREHHFVPRFYLRRFASDRRRRLIHLHNIPRALTKRDIGLRKQCRRTGFYGATDKIEDALAKAEADMAPVLNSIVKSHRLPRPGSAEHVGLLLFVAFQMQRTTAAASSCDDLTDKAMKQIWSRYAMARGINLDQFRIGHERPVLVALSAVAEIAIMLDDLGMLLLLREKGAPAFVTSDNPVFRHNEWVPGRDGIGIGVHGVQLFIPLSPDMLLMLYDKPVYKMKGDRRGGPLTIGTDDLESLNYAQAINADQNLYFSEWDAADGIRQAATRAASLRNRETTFVDEFPEVGNEERSSLLVSTLLGQISTLGLSFVGIKRRMRRIPRHERSRSFRRDRPFREPERPVPLEKKTTVFAKPRQQRPRPRRRDR